MKQAARTWMLTVAMTLAQAALTPDAALAANSGAAERRPDVSVEMVSRSGGGTSADPLTVRFEVTTTDADAPNVTLRAQCTYQRLGNARAIRKQSLPSASVSLGVDRSEALPFVVTCDPSPDERVTSVTLVATVPGGDADPSNNADSWDGATGS